MTDFFAATAAGKKKSSVAKRKGSGRSSFNVFKFLSTTNKSSSTSDMVPAESSFADSKPPVSPLLSPKRLITRLESSQLKQLEGDDNDFYVETTALHAAPSSPLITPRVTMTTKKHSNVDERAFFPDLEANAGLDLVQEAIFDNPLHVDSPEQHSISLKDSRKGSFKLRNMSFKSKNNNNTMLVVGSKEELDCDRVFKPSAKSRRQDAAEASLGTDTEFVQAEEYEW